MSDEHPSLETLADWLSGGLEHEQVLARIVPHLFAGCPTCRERYEDIRRLQAEVGHWNESLVVREGTAAPQRLEELMARHGEERYRLVQGEPAFQAWGLCQLLVRKSAEAVFQDPARAADLAELAVRISGHLAPETYDPAWVEDLKARTWAYFGNAQRVLGELRGADAAFRTAAARLDEGTGDPRLEAEILDLEASLRRAQRRLPEAMERLDRAIGLYRELGDEHRVGRALLKKAKALEETGDLESAIGLLAQSPPLLDREREPRLALYARENLLSCLTRSGRYQEAESLLPEVHALSEEVGAPPDFRRLRWMEGLIAHGLGRREAAEAAFREVQQDFLAQRLAYDAALVALDLAVLYADAGATEELKRLATEVMPVFESREVQREAMAALLLFQSACEEEAMTADLARYIAEALRYERQAPAAPWNGVE